ncbi:MAG: hypothetical protein ACREQK_18255 [Candidatus Binatia bacterium]
MNRRLRSCMITTFYPPYNFGGDGIFVHQLSNELARRDHQVGRYLKSRLASFLLMKTAVLLSRAELYCSLSKNQSPSPDRE